MLIIKGISGSRRGVIFLPTIYKEVVCAQITYTIRPFKGGFKLFRIQMDI